MKILRDCGPCGIITLGLIGILSPIVSIFVVPFYLVKAALSYLEYNKAYNATLLDGKRFKYGRIADQDYTKWNGVASTVKKSEKESKAESYHELVGLHKHGALDDEFSGDANTPSTFNSRKDYKWLKKEAICREKEDNFNEDWRMLRAFAKALVPIGGMLWVAETELQPGGASSFTCPGCMGNEEQHWSWRRAINYHKNKIPKSIKLP